MSPADIILIIVIVIAAGLALRKVIRDKKHGRRCCGGDCCNCGKQDKCG